MGLLDSLFGNKDEQNQPAQGGYAPNASAQQRPQNADEQAIARYRYMLQTAPPEQLEAAHAEAFARLTPEQRQLALQQMAQAVPENERAGLSDDPRSLARAATRAEIRQPGTMERLMNNRGGAGGIGGIGGGGIGGGALGGMGGMLAGSLLTSLAGGFIGSSIANSFFNNAGNEAGFQQSPEAANVEGGASDYNAGDFQETGLSSDADPLGDPGLESGNDFNDAGATDASYDNGGGFDDAGYDSGGGFDGGDFGGGDF